MALIEKQKRFLGEYLVDLNATQAALRAGYSEKTADKIGSQLLGKTRVAEAIQEAMQSRTMRTEITQDKVLDALASMGFVGGDTDTLKLSDKIKALELLMKHMGMFDNKAGRDANENNLQQAIEDSTQEDIDTDDLPEVQ